MFQLFGCDLLFCPPEIYLKQSKKLTSSILHWDYSISTTTFSSAHGTDLTAHRVTSKRLCPTWAFVILSMQVTAASELGMNTEIESISEKNLLVFFVLFCEGGGVKMH